MTGNDTSDQDRVAQLLRETRSHPGDLPEGLTERVLADARRLQPVPRARPGRRGLGGWLDALGGWPSLGGLAAAGCVGFWIGISPPEGLYDPAALLSAPETRDIEEAAGLSGFGWDLLEG